MYLLIVNPTAGKGRSLKRLKEVKEYFAKKNVEYEIIETKYPGHATQLAKEALEKGQREFLSLGGDGTILEISRALIGTDGVLGIIPGGTGNDFIRALNIPNDIPSSIDVILNNNVKKVDVGQTDKGEYFINVAGTGFDVAVLEYTKKFNKVLTGKAAYVAGLLRALFGYKGDELTLTVNGETFSNKSLIIAVANGKAYGGGMMVAPGAKADDGLFHVTLVDMPNRLKILKLLPSFMKGKHAKIKEIRNFTCDKISIESKKELSINVDGEITGVTPVTISLLPKALNVFAPAE